MLVSSSGFEDVIYQSNACSSGSLNGVLIASLYNKVWNGHEVISEPLERLLLKRFLVQVKSVFISCVLLLNCRPRNKNQFQDQNQYK